MQVHQALQHASRTGLIQAIQKQYHAALVDEFQDTDELQYEIFTQLFANGDSLMFMIGDPKQAIYSFRGADLFSYLLAKEKTGHQYTLSKNWRATPALIMALNTIFENHLRPFGYEHITYEKAVAARPDDDSGAPAFQLWYLTHADAQGKTVPVPQSEAVPRIAAAVAEEIVQSCCPAACRHWRRSILRC